jgi:hypothetical protein
VLPAVVTGFDCVGLELGAFAGVGTSPSAGVGTSPSAGGVGDGRKTIDCSPAAAGEAFSGYLCNVNSTGFADALTVCPSG